MPESKNLVFQKNCRITVNENAIAKNMAVIRKLAGCKVIAVIKENGYGCGLYEEFRILDSLPSDIKADMYAVTNSDEALALREYGCTAGILLMSPVKNTAEAQALIEKNISLMLGSEEQAAIMMAASDRIQVFPTVHIKIDTGMGRYGFAWHSIPDLHKLTEHMIVEGTYTHLAGSLKDYKGSVLTQKQRFENALEILRSQGVNPGITHISNSQGLMNVGSLGMDAVRVGSCIIGRAVGAAGRLTDAVTLEAPVMQVFERKKGDTLGYAGTYTLKKDATLALLRVGHSDGIFLAYGDTPERFLPGLKHLVGLLLKPSRGRKYVTINGKRCYLCGRMGISHMVVDITGTDIEEGDIARIPFNPLMVHPYIEHVFVKE